MSEAICGNEGPKRLTEIEAQDAIAACIPDLEKLAWRFFVISRDLNVSEKEDDFALERPGPEHLRWSIAESALAMYYELLELLPYVRKGAVETYAGMLSDWEREQETKAGVTKFQARPRG